MVAAMLGFAIEDAFIKLAAADLPTGQILLMIGLIGGAAFTAMGHLQGQSVWSRDIFAGPVLLRHLGETFGTLGFITALALTPLTNATAIFQATPLAVTFGAAVFLGDHVGWRRWSAIAVGFAGMLIIIRPGMAGFDMNSLWSLLAVTGLSLRDVATRRVPKGISTVQLAAWAFGCLVLLGAAMLLVSGNAHRPDSGQILLVVLAAFFGVFAYWAITAAMRLGEVSVITPFRYSRLVFALIIGALVFGERPDGWMLLGATLIIGSGLYTFARERHRRRHALSMGQTLR